MSGNWGYKINISIYVEGEETKSTAKAVIEATKAAYETMEDAGAIVEFAGASKYTVQFKPYDQVAT